jgi:hypothetical protein
MSNWPESTCIECGERIPAGQIQRCEKGGWCKWRVPAAVRDYIATLQASHAELVKALRPCLGHLADYLDKGGTNKAQPALDNAIAALANAAKLAPTEADGSAA